MYLTLSKAAKETGKSKSVISKAIEDGRLSVVSKEGKSFQIDPAELFRVFPKNDNQNRQKEQSRTETNANENGIKIIELEIRLEVERKEKRFYQEQYTKIESDRDDWKKQAQTLLLQAPPQKATEKPLGMHESDSSVNVGKNASLPSYDLLWAFIIVIISVVLIIATRAHWLPLAESLLKS